MSLSEIIHLTTKTYTQLVHRFARCEERVKNSSASVKSSAFLPWGELIHRSVRLTPDGVNNLLYGVMPRIGNERGPNSLWLAKYSNRRLRTGLPGVRLETELDNE